MKYTNLIYGLRDPRNDVYRYIGKTTIGNGRPLSHLKKSHNIYVNEWIDELSKMNLAPYVDIIEKDISLDKLSASERYYISYYSNLHGQLFNGGIHINESISSPSTLDYTQIDNAITTLLNPGEVYKIVKLSTGFCDEMIASMLNVGRKTVYRLKSSEKTVTLDTVIRLIFFSKYTMDDVFDFYIKSSNEFKGDWPDTHKDFINKCNIDEIFLRTWCNKFYESIVEIKKIKYNKRAKKKTL